MTTCQFWVNSSPAPKCNEKCGERPDLQLVAGGLKLYVCRVAPKDRIFVFDEGAKIVWNSLIDHIQDVPLEVILHTDEYAEDDSEWTIEEEFELRKPKEQ